MSGRNRVGLRRPRAVVIYAKEDVPLVRKLVENLRGAHLDVWWAEDDLSQGAWDAAVRKVIETSDALIPFVTSHTGTHAIFRDEWEHAAAQGLAIFPFVIDRQGLPFGMGAYSHTQASNWQGDLLDEPVRALRSKISTHFQSMSENGKLGYGADRATELQLGQKVLALPAFVFSLSTFETQIHPLDGIQLLGNLRATACLVSAFDLHGNLRQC